RLPAAERRQQLVDTALDLFAAKGLHGTSMDDIAEAAGVTKPVLYQHFRSKRALFLELLDQVGRQLLSAIAAATANATSPRQQVELGLTAYFQFVADHHSSFVLLFGDGTRRDEEFASAVNGVENTIADFVAALIAAGLDDAHRQLLAHAIVGMAESASRRWVASGATESASTAASRVADLAWAGLRAVHR
ncbi:MAG TPA: TetR/AcrR family transcriptional regulator, partial [Acidimicrobiales bacterium]|nr:TetR/AcrR family transcriptional regulator [Acidimicrobiales bacterium]